MNTIYSIQSVEFNMLQNNVRVNIAVFTTAEQKINYDTAVLQHTQNLAKLVTLVEKGDTVVKTEAEKYTELFTDEFRSFLQGNVGVSPAEVDAIVKEKYDALNPVKSGRSTTENEELKQLEQLVAVPLPAVETRIIDLKDVAISSNIVSSITRKLENIFDVHAL